MYGAKRHQNIDDARYDSFMKMTGGNNVLKKVKKVNCASLPPTNKSLMKHIQRANFIAMMWWNAEKPQPNVNNPLDFGWKISESGTFMPIWFEGRAMPDFSHNELESEEETESREELESGSEWSGDSGDSDSDE